MKTGPIKTYQKVSREHPDLHFELSRMEKVYELHQGQADRPHRHNFYTVLLIEKASGEHLVDFHSYPLARNQVFFIAPGQVHQLLEKEKPLGFALLFSVDFLVENNIPMAFIEDLNLFADYGASPPLSLDPSAFQELKFLAEQMEKEHASNHELKVQSIGALLKLFLIQCNRNCKNPTENHSTEQGHYLLKNFKALVDQHYKSWHNTGAYAEALNISSDHLNRVVKSLVGKTSKEYIQSRISIAAKRMLFFSDLSLKEIAFDLGFKEPAHFSAFFKKCTGSSPSDFKKSH